MHSIPEIVPISEFRIHQSQILEKVKQGPVVLAQHSRPAVVLVDAAKWNRIVERMADLEDAVAVLQEDLAVARGEEEDVEIDIDAELETLGDAVPSALE